MQRETRPRAAGRTRIAALIVAIIAAGCATERAAPTLYTELGGEAGIARIVDGMLREIAGDERIAAAFARSNLARLRQLLEEQFCEVSDGPCRYSGFSMLESHRGMAVTETEFNAVVECLLDAMERQEIPVVTQNRLVARLAPLHRDIVYR